MKFHILDPLGRFVFVSIMFGALESRFWPLIIYSKGLSSLCILSILTWLLTPYFRIGYIECWLLHPLSLVLLHPMQSRRHSWSLNLSQKVSFCTFGISIHDNVYIGIANMTDFNIVIYLADDSHLPFQISILF